MNKFQVPRAPGDALLNWSRVTTAILASFAIEYQQGELSPVLRHLASRFQTICCRNIARHRMQFISTPTVEDNGEIR